MSVGNNLYSNNSALKAYRITSENDTMSDIDNFIIVRLLFFYSHYIDT